VHKEFVPQSQTEHQDVYESAPQLLRDFIRRRNPEVWATCKWFLLHDSARPRTVLSVQKLVVGIISLYGCVRQVCHLDIIVCHLDIIVCLLDIIVFIFPRLQRALEGHRYNDIERP